MRVTDGLCVAAAAAQGSDREGPPSGQDCGRFGRRCSHKCSSWRHEGSMLMNLSAVYARALSEVTHSPHTLIHIWYVSDISYLVIYANGKEHFVV